MRPELTGLINLMGEGDAQARRTVIEELYESMLELARRVAWNGGRRGQTQTVELVSQGIAKIGDLRRTWNDRQHFLATFARAIQSVRVDAYRRARRDRDALPDLLERGGDRITADDGFEVDVLDLEQALATLEQEQPVAAEVVRLRFFTQSTHAEVAQDLGLPEIRARRLWGRARNRLRVLLDDGSD